MLQLREPFETTRATTSTVEEGQKQQQKLHYAEKNWLIRSDLTKFVLLSAFPLL